MKKAVWLLSMVGLTASYTANASEGRIYLSSGNGQLEMTSYAPVTSQDELDQAILRLTAQASTQGRVYATDMNSSEIDQAILSLSQSQTSYATSENSYVATAIDDMTDQPVQAATLGKKSAPSVAAAAARRAAHGKSIGRCALYVRRALQSAGYSFTPQASAYMYATNGTLKNAGFVKLNNDGYVPQVGDVAVFNRTSRNPHGHIQIYDGNQWVSDFRQPKFSPYSQHNGYSVWRDARYLDASSTNGTYLAYNE